MLKEALALKALELPPSPSYSIFGEDLRLFSSNDSDDIQVRGLVADITYREGSELDLNRWKDQEIPYNEQDPSRNALHLSSSENLENPPKEDNHNQPHFIDQNLERLLEEHNDYQPPLENENLVASELLHNPPREHNCDQYSPKKSFFTLTVENASAKYRVFESTAQRKLEFETSDAKAVQNMVNKIRKSYGKSEEIICIDELRCTLNDDFSYYLEIKAIGSEEYESYKTNPFKCNDMFHNLNGNITDHFMTEEFLTDHFMMVEFVEETDFNTCIRQALKKFKRSPNIPKRANRLPNSEVMHTWKTIEEDYKFVKNYFKSMIDKYFAQYVEETFKRTWNSLNETLTDVRTSSHLEEARQAFASNQSAMTKEVFSLWVKKIQLLATTYEENEIYETSLTPIVDRISADAEAFKLIWLMGYPQSIKKKISNFVKQRSCNLSRYGAKVQKATKSKKSKKATKAKGEKETTQTKNKRQKKDNSK